MPILYINPLPKELKLIVLSEDGTIIFETEKMKNNDEFSFFPELLHEVVSTHSPEAIWCVTGPGPFTLMRIITLAINSIAYARPITLKSCNFFDLVSDNHTPIIEANAREFLTRGKDGNTESLPKAEIGPGIYEGIFGKIDFVDGQTFVEYREDSSRIVEVFQQKASEERITPIYFKPPHITCSTKKT